MLLQRGQGRILSGFFSDFSVELSPSLFCNSSNFNSFSAAKAPGSAFSSFIAEKFCSSLLSSSSSEEFGASSFWLFGSWLSSLFDAAFSSSSLLSSLSKNSTSFAVGICIVFPKSLIAISTVSPPLYLFLFNLSTISLLYWYIYERREDQQLALYLSLALCVCYLAAGCYLSPWSVVLPPGVRILAEKSVP